MKSGHDTCMGYPNRYSSCIPNWWKICCKNSGDPGRTIAVVKNGMKTFFPLPRDRFLPYKNGGRRRWQNKQEGSENCNANTSLVHVKYVLYSPKCLANTLNTMFPPLNFHKEVLKQ